MALKGIDISHYNGWPFNSITEQAYQQSDFVIIKATQWMASYKWEGYYRPAMDRARKDGKLLAAYHYATGLTAKREAAYFYSIIKDDLAKGDIIPAIDWEPDDNSAWRSTMWVKAFNDAFYALAGIYPMLYTGVTGCGDCANVATLVPLWFAGYPDNRNSWTVPTFPARYNIGKFKDWKIWQYTSSGGKLDRNTSTLTKKQWQALCKPINKETSKETKTEAKTGTSAADVIAVLNSWIGKSRAAGTHKDIIDLYNSYTPRARGYKVTYTDDYCATTVSAAFIACGAVDLIGGTECGVERMIEDVFKKAGIWNEDGSITPQTGDIICYNWDDSTQPNDGWADHIGVVESVDKKAKTFVVIEGNMNGVVGRRTVKFGWGQIRGFARPKYAATSNASGSNSVKAETMKPTAATPANTGAPSKTPKWTGVVYNCSLLNVRTWAGTENQTIKSWPKLAKGNEVDVCDTVKAKDGSKWYYIRIAGKYYGFVKASYIKKK